MEDEEGMMKKQRAKQSGIYICIYIYTYIYIYELNSQELHISTELFYVRSSINSEQVSTFILLRFQQAEGFRFEYRVSINNIQLFFVKIKLLHNFICYHFFFFSTF